MEKKDNNPSSGKPEEKKDFSTAILDRKKAPHRLMAEEGLGPSEDNSVLMKTQKKWTSFKFSKLRPFS